MGRIAEMVVHLAPESCLKSVVPDLRVKFSYDFWLLHKLLYTPGLQLFINLRSLSIVILKGVVVVQLAMEIQLEKLLRELEKEDDFSKWKVIRGIVEKKLQTVARYFPHFSRHDKTHSEQIAIQIANLLGRKRIEKLSASDLLMILAAIYYHDIGMALEYEDIRDECTSEPFEKFICEHLHDDSDLGKSCRLVHQIDFSHTVTANIISLDIYRAVLHVIEDMSRGGHAQRSSNCILRDDMLERLIGLRLRRTLAQICEMHQKDVSNIMQLDPEVNGIYGDYVHPRFVAAMLLLGDLLDLDSNRFDEVFLKASTPLPEFSLVHKKKHEFVQSYLVQKGEIKLTFDANDVERQGGKKIVQAIKIYREMRQWCDWIKKACEFYSLHWGEIIPIQEFGNAPRFSECVLKLRGETHYSELLDLSYMISGHRLFDLVKGKNIYKNKFVCIREVIQNAVDVTILRLFIEGILPKNDEDGVRKILSDGSINWADYKVHGEVQTKKNGGETYVEVAIRDYGTGVSEFDIKKIARIDNKSSKIREDTIRSMPVWFRPSGVFGLGLQSIFLLTSQFEMITRTIDEPPKRIVFYAPGHGDHGYIDVSRYKQPWKQGTLVRFCIERNKLEANDIGCPDYYFSTDKYIIPLLRRIYTNYKNIHIEKPVDYFSQELYDYVPVELDIDAKTILGKSRFRQCTVLPLGGDEPSIEVTDGRMSIEMFVLEIGCYIWCDISLEPEYRINKENDHIYRTIRHLQYMKYGGSILFRNIYVSYEMFSSRLHLDKAVPLFIDWRINLLSDPADEVLTISRDHIQDSYQGVLRNKLQNGIQELVKKGIDYLIARKSIEIKDTILLFYQAAIQNSYHIKEIEDMYLDVLKNIRIGGYYIHANKQERVFDPINLRKKSLYFVLNMIPTEKSFNDSIIQLESEAVDVSQEELYYNMPVSFFEQHILTHRPYRCFIGKRNTEFMLVVEAIPFENYKPKESAIELAGEFLFRQMVLSMFKNGYRGFYPIHGYERLAVSLDFDFSGTANISSGTQEYYISLPIEEFAKELFIELREKGYVESAVHRFFDRIKSSPDFMHGVDYVCRRNEESRNKIVSLYEALIQKILRLLSDEKYKDENRMVLESQNNDELIFDYNKLKISPYMYF